MALVEDVDVDDLLATQDGLQLRRIAFVRAPAGDGGVDELRKRYKPINAAFIQNTGSLQNRGDKSLASSSSAASADGASASAPSELAPARTLYPLGRIPALLQWHSVPRPACGLRNLGNTCFLNSVLQCLTYTPPLAQYLMRHEASSSAGSSPGGFHALRSFEKHVNLVFRSKGAIAPSDIVRNLRAIAKHFRLGRQEDAHEFFRFFIEALQRSFLRGKDRGIPISLQMTTPLYQIFGGYTRNQIKCPKCQHESNTTDPILDLSVDIYKTQSLEDALRAFVRPEVLDKNNKYRCEKCNDLVCARKQMTLHKVPNVLVVHLKRFSFDGSKINRHISYPKSINISPFTSSPKAPADVFDLTGVDVHLGGTVHSGHYYAIVRSPAGVWLRKDDESVHTVGESSALGQRAYMLFYTRRKPIPVPKTLNPLPTLKVAEQIQSIGIRLSSICPSPRSVVAYSPRSKLELIAEYAQRVFRMRQAKQEFASPLPSPVARRTRAKLKTRKRGTALYTDHVGHWDDASASALARFKIMRNDEKLKPLQRRKRDEWDIEYDRGRARKRRKKEDFNEERDSTSNVFQRLHEKRKGR